MDRRVRTGCITCRKRQVKCDEAKPSCQRCRTANFVCEGYTVPRRVSPELAQMSASASASVQASISPPRGQSAATELAWRHNNWRQEQLPLYHHFVTTTVARLFRTDHVGFWRDEVAQMSYGVDIVYESLLAIGAIHRSSLLVCQSGNFEEASKSKVLALRSYGNALRLLPNHLYRQTESEVVGTLTVLMLLTYFECFQENPKGAFQHLWAAMQVLQRSGDALYNHNNPHMVPIFDSMLRLDFQAQKLVPYAASSFSNCPSRALMEKPFWNRPSLPEYSRSSYPDLIAVERQRLIQLICGHNGLSRVIWGLWCPTSERPSRDELMGYYSEMCLWKANSPATFARCKGLDHIEAFDSMAANLYPIPPPACQLLSNEMAVTIIMYNAYLGCCLAMLGTTDEDSAAREQEGFILVYQSLCIAAGLIGSRTNPAESRYKSCDAISMGVSMYLYHGIRRSYSLVWQEWGISALRSIGREGLSNGYTGANTSEIMCQLEAKMQHQHIRELDPPESPLGYIRDRLIPLLLPRGDDDQILAFYLRCGNEEVDGDEQAVEVVAKAMWEEDPAGTMRALRIDVYEEGTAGTQFQAIRPQAVELFHSWRQKVEKGWHGYLTTEVQEGFLRKEVEF